MKTTTIIIGLGSIGFILMGLFIMYSKSILNTMIVDGNELKTKKFIKQNSIINISVGIIGICFAIIDWIVNGSTNIVIVLFISMIFISSFVQLYLSKKYRQN